MRMRGEGTQQVRAGVEIQRETGTRELNPSLGLLLLLEEVAPLGPRSAHIHPVLAVAICTLLYCSPTCSLPRSASRGHILVLIPREEDDHS